MRERVVALIGAGNMRCARHVLPALASWRPDAIVEFRLFDTNEERLDLADRCLRRLCEEADTEPVIVATSQLDEALAGATDCLLTIHEDCARRLRGKSSADLYEPADAADETFQVRGDPNKPTPPDRLSDHTHAILSAPKDVSLSRASVIAEAAESILAGLPVGVRVLSLLRDVELVPTIDQLKWPAAPKDTDRPLIPHELLRWINGDPEINLALKNALDSPLAAWLEGRR